MKQQMTQIRLVEKMLDGTPIGAACKAMSISTAVAEMMTRASDLGGIARESECRTAFEIVVDGKVVETHHIVE
jgi:hypothetical protein